MIDTMIQEELARFTSLDSPAETPIDESSFALRSIVEGARPLDASEFVDPSEWFSGDEEVEHAIENVRDSAPAGATMGWLESGSKDEGLGLPKPQLGSMEPSLDPSNSRRSSVGGPVKTFRPPIADRVSAPSRASNAVRQRAPATPQPAKPRGPRVAAIVAVAVLLGAAGVVAGWFLTQ